MRAAPFLAIPALVAAIPSSPVLEPALLIERDDALGVTEPELAEMKFFMEQSASAYCNVKTPVGELVTCDREGNIGSKCPSLEADSPRILWNYQGGFTKAAAYIAINDARKQIVFAGRGTMTDEEWLTNINIAKKPYPGVQGALVHTGFHNAWTEMAGKGALQTILGAIRANPGYRIVATGHSLGGAVATMAAGGLRKLGLSVDLYTYGAPRVGNAAFNDFLVNKTGQNYRVTNLDDPIPRVPFLCWGYRSISPEYWLSQQFTGLDYPIEDIKVCEGGANLECNGGTRGFDLTNHDTYFNTSGCIDINDLIGGQKVFRGQLSELKYQGTNSWEDEIYCTIGV